MAGPNGLQSNMNVLSAAVRIGGTVWSHAGVTQRCLETMILRKEGIQRPKPAYQLLSEKV